MTKFEKPGRREDFDYPDMAKEAATNALNDAGVKYTDIEQACVEKGNGSLSSKACRQPLHIFSIFTNLLTFCLMRIVVTI